MRSGEIYAWLHVWLNSYSVVFFPPSAPPLLCSSVHVDTTEVIEVHSYVIFCTYEQYTDSFFLYICFAYLLKYRPPEINQCSITVILPKKCKIMFCVFFWWGVPDFYRGWILLSNFLYGFKQLLYINPVFVFLIVTLYKVPLQ